MFINLKQNILDSHVDMLEVAKKNVNSYIQEKYTKSVRF